MLAHTCGNNIVKTLDYAFTSASGQLRVDIHNAIVSIKKCFLQTTDVQVIKRFVKNTLQSLKIFTGYKRQIEKFLKKLK